MAVHPCGVFTALIFNGASSFSHRARSRLTFACFHHASVARAAFRASEMRERAFLPPQRSCCSLSASFSLFSLYCPRPDHSSSGGALIFLASLLSFPRILLACIASRSLRSLRRVFHVRIVRIDRATAHCSCRTVGGMRKIGPRNFIRYASVASALSSAGIFRPFRRHSRPVAAEETN